MEKKIKCLYCGKIGSNMLADPHDYTVVSIYHSKRTDTEYYYKCPHCCQITIYLSTPK